MTIRGVFARNLRRLRHERGLSQEALAYEADIDRTYVSALEREVYSATLDMVEKLANILGVEPVKLLERPIKGEKTPAGRSSPLSRR